MATKLGRVSSVFVDEDLNRIFVNVSTGPGVERKAIPWVSSKASFWLVPEEGDIVEVYEVDREWCARFSQHTPTQRLPEGLSGGDVCLKLDEETQIKFQKNEEENYDVTIECNGDLRVKSGKEIRLIDDDGYGIVGAGSGNFTWYHESVDFVPEQRAEQPDEGGE